MWTWLAKICCGRFTICFVDGFASQVISETKKCVVRDLQENGETFLYEYNRKYNFCKSSQKLAFIPFCIFL